jgi:hypothetical protein
MMGATTETLRGKLDALIHAANAAIDPCMEGDLQIANPAECQGVKAAWLKATAKDRIREQNKGRPRGPQAWPVPDGLRR